MSTLTTQGMILEREHPLSVSYRSFPPDLKSVLHHRENEHIGVQRLYRWGNFGLSAVDPPILHFFPFAWEFAVIEYHPTSRKVDDFHLTYESDLTQDVVVVGSVEEASAFVRLASRYFSSPWRQTYLHLKGVIKEAINRWIVQGYEFMEGRVELPINEPGSDKWLERSNRYFDRKRHYSVLWRD